MHNYIGLLVFLYCTAPLIVVVAAVPIAIWASIHFFGELYDGSD